jgi:hypothetical protein
MRAAPHSRRTLPTSRRSLTAEGMGYPRGTAMRFMLSRERAAANGPEEI